MTETTAAKPTEAPAYLLRLLKAPGIKRLRLHEHPAELLRFLRFALVGAFGMVVDLSILNFCHKALGLPLLISNTISFSAAVASNFTWNRLWTFPESRGRPFVPQLAQFALVNIIGLGINNVVLMAVKHAIAGGITDPWDYNLAKITAIGVVLFWNYFVNRKWTYRGIG